MAAWTKIIVNEKIDGTSAANLRPSLYFAFLNPSRHRPFWHEDHVSATQTKITVSCQYNTKIVAHTTKEWQNSTL